MLILSKRNLVIHCIKRFYCDACKCKLDEKLNKFTGWLVSLWNCIFNSNDKVKRGYKMFYRSFKGFSLVQFFLISIRIKKITHIYKFAHWDQKRIFKLIKFTHSSDNIFSKIFKLSYKLLEIFFSNLLVYSLLLQKIFFSEH